MEKSKSKTGLAHLEHRVMERIRAENVTMRSSVVFGIISALTGIGVFLSLFLGVFFVSLAFNRLAIPRVFGLRFTLLHFPWFSVGLALSCFLISFSLIEHYKLAYKWTLFRLAAVLLVVFFTLGFVVHKSPLHDRLAQSRFGGLYVVEGSQIQIFTGHVLEVRTDKSFMFDTIYGTRLHVYVTADTKIPTAVLSEDQSLVIAGTREGDIVFARGILNLGERRRQKALYQ